MTVASSKVTRPGFARKIHVGSEEVNPRLGFERLRIDNLQSLSISSKYLNTRFSNIEPRIGPAPRIPEIPWKKSAIAVAFSFNRRKMRSIAHGKTVSYRQFTSSRFS